MTKRTPPYSREVRERAVRMVFDHQGEHSSQWAAIQSITAKIGCSSCLVAERHWDAARWAIKAHAWRFEGVRRRAVTPRRSRIQTSRPSVEVLVNSA